eukprot:CAMPEP_0201601322 /NCGR_PEP_ID=MMETSP0492-20130828/2304_1 /ASSEMBLY_ACC=CAM_ASM_000837 /TAXON_ID=420259 /ORGANISM="Thalassiosira gravida, Strain GMp14c1" /LENGTH=110 /DNA_ID=CAMNT_0048064489 /DNA_START=499 /DNA_END=831 /DNA_ORIENTATION=+
MSEVLSDDPDEESSLSQSLLLSLPVSSVSHDPLGESSSDPSDEFSSPLSLTPSSLSATGSLFTTSTGYELITAILAPRLSFPPNPNLWTNSSNDSSGWSMKLLPGPGPKS